MSLSRYFPNGEPRISTIPSESNINSSRFGVKCTTPWGSHRLWHYSWVCLFPGAGLNPHPGCFKAIKKLACSEVATFLFCFFIYLGLLANAREPKRGCFKAIKKLACSEVATFLFCFFPVIKASFPTVLKAKKPAFRLAF